MENMVKGILPNKKYDETNMALRYYIGFENTEKRFNLLKDFLSRSGIRRVMLFTASFAGDSSIKSKEYYRKHSQLLYPYVETLKQAGIVVDVNMLYTVGHAYYADENEFGFKRAITIDGEKSRGCVCMLDEKWREFVKEVYGYYAELKPNAIHMDDDIRAMSLGKIVCLCEDHIKAISKRVNRKVLREDIKRAIFSDEFELSELKKAFYDEVKENIESVMSDIADAVHKISPNTNLGIMTARFPDVTLDRDIHEFFAKYCDKKINSIRTGIPFYREGEMKEMPLLFSMPAIQRGLIDNDKVSFQPEIENDIYGFLYKSNAVTNMQIVWCLTSGFKNMQLNLFSYLDVQPDNYEEITKLFSKRKKYYNKLGLLIPENKRASGVYVYAHPRAMFYRRTVNGELNFGSEWYKYLQVDGLPVGYDKNDSDWNLLTDEDILGASDIEIDQLLKKGAVIDLKAAESLVYRGFGNRIGISEIGGYPEIFAGERLTDHVLNEQYKGCYNSDYFYNSLIEKGLVKDIKYCVGAEILSEIIDHNKKRVCNGLTVYENEKGERFCIMPTSYNIFSQFSNITNKRKKQLINVFEWIARKELPVYSFNELVCVIINHFKNYNVISLFNIASDDVLTPSIAYRVKGDLYFIDGNGCEKPLSYKIEDRKITLNKRIKAKGELVLIDRW